MPRPRRLEYENAVYHVMNRGRARQSVFHGKKYYEAFLETLEQANKRFDCIIHAYCLMSNHYHLLLETPNANLSRIMRHINGVYTQRHNRLQNTDGPLFRGRYKAILVDGDSYLLQLSRYIHRNPIDTTKPMVHTLEKYQWSSYPAYIGKVKAPDWLSLEPTYGMLGYKKKYLGYESYVTKGVDEEIQQYYNKGNIATIIGNKDFKEWVYVELYPELESEDKGKELLRGISMDDVVNGVAKYANIPKQQILKVVKGPQKGNDLRKIAMYLSQELADSKLTDIAKCFNLTHGGSVSFITHQVRKKKREDREYSRKIDMIIKSIVKI